MNKLALFSLMYFMSFVTGVHGQPYIDSFDINKAINQKSSNPYNLCADGNTLFFIANDSTYGNELWVFFADSKTPTRITDIFPDTNSSMLNSFTITNQTAVIDGVVYFAAGDTVTGIELWSYKLGYGTRFIADINSGYISSHPRHFTGMNGKIYFAAALQGYGSELFSYDPVADVVKRLSDLDTSTIGNYVNEIVSFNNKIYFQGSTFKTGIELFSYDPTTDTVELVADIYPGTKFGSPSHFVVVGNKLYFTAISDTHGNELYEYTGSGMPNRISDLYPGAPAGFYGDRLVELSGKLYFCGYDAGSNTFQLMKFDPVAKVASVAATINPAGTYINQLTVFENKLFFAADDGVNGYELWQYNGTSASRITDIVTGSTSSGINNITATGLNLYFTASGASIGNELFRYSRFALGVQDVDFFDGSISVYPNPTRANSNIKINLSSTESVRVIIMNSIGDVLYNTGDILFEKSEDNTIMLPTAQYPSGTYFYNIVDKQGNIKASGKLVKM